MARPAPYALNLYQGDSVLLKFQYTDAKGEPVDLTGGSVRLASKVNINDASPAVLIHGQIYNAPLGKFAFSLSPADSKIIPLETIYDIEVTQSNGFVRTIMKGVLSMEQEVY
jgi:hypothetical protein